MNHIEPVPKLGVPADAEALFDLYKRRRVYLRPDVCARVIRHATNRALKRVRGANRLQRARISREDIRAAFDEVCK